MSTGGGDEEGYAMGSPEEERAAVGPVLICGKALEAGESVERHHDALTWAQC